MTAARLARRLAPALLLAAVAARPAQAETRTVPGGELVFNTNASEDVTIAVDPSLHGQMRFSMDAGLSCLAIAGTSTVTVSTSRCDDDAGHLRIDVMPGTPVTLSSSGSGDIQLAGLDAPVRVTLSGSGDLVAGNTGPLILSVRASGDATLGDVNGPAEIDMNGNGNVHAKAIHGPLKVRQVGSGDFVAGAMQGGDAVLDGNGSGDILIGDGHIENLQANMNGGGDLSIAASVRDATVNMRGGGDAKLGPVSGTLQQNADSGSGIVVLDAAHARAIADQAERKLGGHGGTLWQGTRGSSGRLGLENILTVAFVGLVLFICFRIVRRAGGLPGLGRKWRGNGEPVPSNPGVLALGETMTRLEQRLGRMESYVTTREFDLTRKFRELGPQ